jgi:hypothetical protein
MGIWRVRQWLSVLRRNLFMDFLSLILYFLSSFLPPFLPFSLLPPFLPPFLPSFFIL